MKKETYAKLCRKITAMEEELASELGGTAAEEVQDEVVSVEDDAETMLDEDDDFEEIDNIDIEEGDEELPPAEEEVPVDDNSEVAEVMSACASIESRIAEIEGKEEEKAEDDDAKEVLKACKEMEAKLAKMEKKSSQVAKGIEDEIGDEAHGGDASVSNIVDCDVDCATDKEVFPTNSEYVAKITARLDRVASELEKRGMKRMAFRVDQLSDKLEASIR